MSLEPRVRAHPRARLSLAWLSSARLVLYSLSYSTCVVSRDSSRSVQPRLCGAAPRKRSASGRSASGGGGLALGSVFVSVSRFDVFYFVFEFYCFSTVLYTRTGSRRVYR